MKHKDKTHTNLRLSGRSKKKTFDSNNSKSSSNYIKKNSKQIKIDNALNSRQLREIELKRTIKLSWLIDNYGTLLDDKSLASLTNSSNEVISRIRNIYTKLDKKKIIIEEKLIKKEIEKTTERKIELGIKAKKQTELGKIKNSIEKDIKDYLKKGSNLYDN
tara:strand:- start:116 stop:598 length:483 start_codon:yes stop_codon:yes gene_type:complete